MGRFLWFRVWLQLMPFNRVTYITRVPVRNCRATGDLRPQERHCIGELHFRRLTGHLKHFLPFFTRETTFVTFLLSFTLVPSERGLL